MLKYEIKKLPKSEIEIQVTVPEEDMEIHRKKACDEISREVKVKGFRPGHVPEHVLENYVQKEYITGKAQEIALQKTYADIVIKDKIQVISRPRVKIEKEEPFTYIATVAVLPDVEIDDYKSIKIPKEDVKVTDKDIEAVIEDMKKYATTYKDVERKAKKGDRVEIDFEGFDKGKPVENTKSKNHPVILGENTLIPGFEDNIIGMEKDGEKEFDITFPKDYGKEDFRNKKLKFKVKLNRIEEPKEPEVDENLVEKVTGRKKSVEDFKKDIEKNIKAKKDQQAEQERENKYLEELLRKTKVEIPDSLINEETEYILKDMKDDIEMKGLKFEQFLEHNKLTEEGLKKKYGKEAERRIKVRLALQELIKNEKIEVSEKEIKDEFDIMKSHYPEEEAAKLEQEYNKNPGIKNQITNKLALNKLFKKVLP